MSSEYVPILLFHRVCPDDDLPDSAITPEFFERILGFLYKKYYIISLEDYFFKERNKLDKPPLIITFDNIYTDFLEYSLPLLKKYNMPVTLFVSAANIDQQLPDWNHIFDLLFIQSSKLSIAAPPGSNHFQSKSSWESIQARIIYSKKLKRYLHTLSVERRSQLINFYYDQLYDSSVKMPHVLSWKDLLLVKNQGIEIGTHISTINKGGNIFDEKQLEKDLQYTTLRIREQLGNSPAAVSFDLLRNNSKIKNMIHLSGYKLGLAIGNRPYIRVKYGRYSLPRIEMFNENFLLSRLRINGTISALNRLFGKWK